MKDPQRLLESADFPTDVARLLRVRDLPSAIPGDVERRGRAHAARLAAIPAGAVATWFSFKAVAAVVAAGALTTTGAVVVWHQTHGEETTNAPMAVPSEPQRIASKVGHDSLSAPVERTVPSEETEESTAVVETEPEVSIPAPAVTAAPRRSPHPVKSAVVVRPGADSLQEEATLLEKARAQLAADPQAALAVARQHARRFARGQLRSERQLIEMDALRRTGQFNAARALAKRALAAQPDGLYAERVRKLLQALPPDERN